MMRIGHQGIDTADEPEARLTAVERSGSGGSLSFLHCGPVVKSKGSWTVRAPNCERLPNYEREQAGLKPTTIPVYQFQQ